MEPQHLTTEEHLHCKLWACYAPPTRSFNYVFFPRCVMEEYVLRSCNSLDHASFLCECELDDCESCSPPSSVSDSPPLSPGWAKVKESRVGLASKIVAVMQEGVEQHNRAQLWMRVALVIVVGCAAVIPAECIVKRDPDGMKMITFSNFLFAIVSNIPDLSNRRIPMKRHAVLVGSNYAYNHLQSLAFAMGLPMTIALVVKNGGMVAQMLVGACMAGERYTARQLSAAVTVTIGILITAFSSKQPSADPSSSSGFEVSLVPVGLMLLAMLSRAVGNLASQQTIKTCGKHYAEMLFMQHALGLPLLLADWQGLCSQAQRWSEELYEAKLPVMWLYLMASMVLTYVATRASAEVVGLSSPVMLNLVLTLQRFVSIVASAAIINAPPQPPPVMWVGACLVLAGCVVYVLAPVSNAKVMLRTNSKPK